MHPRPEYWFPAKRAGWGWGLPLRWQGWLTLAVHVAVLAAAGVLLRHGHHVLARYLIVGFATVMLIVVCLLKGEPLGGDSNG